MSAGPLRASGREVGGQGKGFIAVSALEGAAWNRAYEFCRYMSAFEPLERSLNIYKGLDSSRYGMHGSECIYFSNPLRTNAAFK
jgi:hypothetical protein